MPKPLDERITAAMANDARAATVKDLIVEVAATVATTQADHDRLDALSKSAAATEAEADAAADEVAKLARKILRLSAKGDQLTNRLEALMNSERRKRGEEAYAQAKATRDQLAADLTEHWPALTGEIAKLLARIVASDAECEMANAARYGGEWLASAEAVARDCPGNFYLPGGSPILRLTKIRLPALKGARDEIMAWPPHRPNPMNLVIEDQRKSAAQAKLARETENARWARYVVTPPSNKRVAIETRRGAAFLDRKTIVAEMTAQFVKDARKSGCTVESAKADETMALPATSPWIS